MRITINRHGQAPKVENNVASGAKLGDLVQARSGETVFLQRNGAMVEGVGPDTRLADGDTITVIQNKTVGR